jgi:hypothetical protein
MVAQAVNEIAYDTVRRAVDALVICDKPEDVDRIERSTTITLGLLETIKNRLPEKLERSEKSEGVQS